MTLIGVLLLFPHLFFSAHAISFRGWVNPSKQTYHDENGNIGASVYSYLDDGESGPEVIQAYKEYRALESHWRKAQWERRKEYLVGISDCNLSLKADDYLQHAELLVKSGIKLRKRFVNIGAFDGVTEDPLLSYVVKYSSEKKDKVQGLYFEKDIDMCRTAFRNLNETQTVVCEGLGPSNIVEMIEENYREIGLFPMQEEDEGTVYKNQIVVYQGDDDENDSDTEDSSDKEGGGGKEDTSEKEGKREKDDPKDGEKEDPKDNEKEEDDLKGFPIHNLDVIKIDIDSFDATLLKALLEESHFKPIHYIVEVNPAIPPPYKFATMYDPNLFPAMLNKTAESVSRLNPPVENQNSEGSEKNLSASDESEEVLDLNGIPIPTKRTDAKASQKLHPTIMSPKMHDWPLRGMSLSYVIDVMKQHNYDFVSFNSHDAYFVERSFRHIYASSSDENEEYSSSLLPPYDEFDCYHNAFITSNGVPIELTRKWFYYSDDVWETVAEIFAHMTNHALKESGTTFPFVLSV